MININSQEVQKLYIAYFGRPADPSGINYWLSNLNNFLNVKEISSELSIQEEYKGQVSNNKSIEFKINKLYLNLFNRKVDFEGLNYWIDKIDNKYNISDIVCDLISSKHKLYPINLEQESRDMHILENKVMVAELFTKQISKSITLINLYQPDSISPWSSGDTLLRVTHFMSTINHEKFFEPK